MVVRVPGSMPRPSSSAAGSSGSGYSEAMYRDQLQRPGGGVQAAVLQHDADAAGREPRPGRTRSRPSTSTVPPAIGRRPTHTSTVEVFPAPLGPTRAVTCPAGASKDRPETAVRAP